LLKPFEEFWETSAQWVWDHIQNAHWKNWPLWWAGNILALYSGGARSKS